MRFSRQGWLCFALAFCALTFAAQARTASERRGLLFASSLSRPEAEWALGDAQASAHPGCVFGASGLRLGPEQWLRYRAEDNIDLREGMLSLWFTEPEEAAVLPAPQYLFATRIRAGALFVLQYDPTKKPAEAVFWVSSDGRTQQKVSVPILPTGGWHPLVARWNDEGELRLSCDNREARAKNAGAIPRVPSAFMLDLFVGSNAKQLEGGPWGRRAVFSGQLKDLRIYDSFSATPDSAFPPPRETVRPAVAFPASAFDPLPGRPHFDIVLNPTKARWEANPVRVDVDLGPAFASAGGAQRRAILNSLRLVRIDLASGRAQPTGGSGAPFHPFVLSDEFQWQSLGTVRWLHRGPLPAAYRLSFDLDAAPDTRPVPEEIPMVGNGDALALGRKGERHPIAAGIRGMYDLWDADGDGDLDLILSGGEYKPGSENLPNGLYYFEQLGPERPGIFAPGRLVYRDNLPYGELGSITAPQIADVNGDGKPDLVLLSADVRQWSEFELLGGRPVLTRHHPILLDWSNGAARKDTDLERGRVVDFDGDGRWDLLQGRTVRLNRGPAGELDFRNAEVLALEFPASDDPSLIPTGDYQWIDWDGDGRRDLIAGNWVGIPYYFRGLSETRFDKPRAIRDRSGHELFTPGVFFFPKAVDFDGDGDLDLTWTSERAALAWNENDASSSGSPELLPTRYFRQLSAYADAGALVVPVVTDWDGDGDLDLIVGAADESLYYYENIGTRRAPVWADSVRMDADGAPIILRGGFKGSIQGRAENDWAYSNPEVADLDGDGLPDLIVNGVEGRPAVFRNLGPRSRPQLTRTRGISVDWKGAAPVYPEALRFTPHPGELVIAQRSRPAVLDWDGDGIMDLVAMDAGNQLALYRGLTVGPERWTVAPGVRLFSVERPFDKNYYETRPVPGESGWNFRWAGRTVTHLVDWDRDGKVDLIWDGVNARFYRNEGSNAAPRFVDRGDLVKERLVRHNNAPYAVDFDGDGWLDLVIGTEAGRLYYFSRPYVERDTPPAFLVTPNPQ